MAGKSKVSYGNALRYAFHVILHPLDGFWDLKYEQRGSVWAALTIVVLTIITFSLEKQGTGFLFNPNRLSEINVLTDILTVALLYILWCAANWCTTSLMDGKGRMIDILTAVGYALFPLVLVRLPMIAVSHFITLSEGAFYYVCQAVSVLWTGLLIFTATMETHQYSAKRTLFTCIITVVGIGIMLFIGLLFFSVIQQMITFVMTIYKEIRFR